MHECVRIANRKVASIPSFKHFDFSHKTLWVQNNMKYVTKLEGFLQCKGEWLSGVF